MDRQTRAYNVRAAESPLIVEGTAIVFNQPAQLPGMTERIERSALNGVNLDDVVLLLNHDGTGMTRSCPYCTNWTAGTNGQTRRRG